MIFPGVMTSIFGYNLPWSALLHKACSSCKGEIQAYAKCYTVLIEDYMAYIFQLRL